MSLFEKIPAKWRKVVYIAVAVLTAGMFALGWVAPEQFDSTVSEVTRIATGLATLFGSLMALANLTPDE
mgnify:CR=1 FL=1